MISRKSTAFTLIELLIVIGVLGILAAGLLAAVDPFEQLKKARDANNRNAVIELHNAYTRYYATHGSLPWDYTAGGSAACLNLTTTTFVRPGSAPYTAVPVDDGTGTSDMSVCIDDLESDGELKAGFVTALGGQAAKMFVTSPSTTQVIVCFSPEGKGLFKDASTKWDNTGQIDLTLPAALCADKTNMVTGQDCFWCAR